MPKIELLSKTVKAAALSILVKLLVTFRDKVGDVDGASEGCNGDIDGDNVGCSHSLSCDHSDKTLCTHSMVDGLPNLAYIPGKSGSAQPSPEETVPT